MENKKDNHSEEMPAGSSLLDTLNKGTEKTKPLEPSFDELQQEYLARINAAGTHYRLYHHTDIVTYERHQGPPNNPLLIPTHDMAIDLSLKTQLMIEMTTYAELLNHGWRPIWPSNQLKYGLVLENTFNRVAVGNHTSHNIFVFGIVVKDHTSAQVLKRIFASRIGECFIPPH